LRFIAMAVPAELTFNRTEVDERAELRTQFGSSTWLVSNGCFV
jgi:hypothetical protein